MVFHYHKYMEGCLKTGSYFSSLKSHKNNYDATLYNAPNTNLFVVSYEEEYHHCDQCEIGLQYCW